VGKMSRSNAFDASILRAIFGKENKLADQDWLRIIFKKIVDVITEQSVAGERIDLVAQGESFECDIPSAPASLTDNPCHVLRQNFNGAILMLKTEPATNSLVVFLGGFPEINCGVLNGEVSKVFPEGTDIVRCDGTAFWC
jgi:hypothetical protein